MQQKKKKGLKGGGGGDQHHKIQKVHNLKFALFLSLPLQDGEKLHLEKNNLQFAFYKLRLVKGILKIASIKKQII